MDRFRDLLETGGSSSRTSSEEYASLLVDEILSAKDLSEEEQADLIK